MEWHLFKADKSRKKWSIRGTLRDGRVVKLPAHRDRKIAEEIMRNVASLARSAYFGHLPDPSLKEWIAGLPGTVAKRYVDLGLLADSVLDRRRPIQELVDAFADHVRSSLSPTSKHAKTKPEKVRRLFSAIGPNVTLEKLDPDMVNDALKEMKALGGRRKMKLLAQKTRREYIFAMKSFCKWMVVKRKAPSNPLEGMIAPSAKGDPCVNRRPLKVAQFSKLASYLRTTAPLRYSHQLYPWSAVDRLMVYWTAVMTGFRANELRSLTVASVNFDVSPATITIEGRVAKNRTKATVPIPNDFAHALRTYSKHLDQGQRLLRIPSGQTLTRALYRDLDAAGICRVYANGELVDFHTLRSTAICWWITENKLDLLQVQRRARLKTLSLVQDYVRCYAPDHADLIEGSPKVIEFNFSDEGDTGKDEDDQDEENKSEGEDNEDDERGADRGA